MSAIVQKPRTESPHETAPLLNKSTADDVESSGEAHLEAGTSRQQSIQALVRKLWQWTFKHRVIIAITLLLLGGVVALCVYFASTL